MTSALRCPARHACRVAALALAALAPLAAHAELPVEQASIAALPPADAYRLYLVDPAMGHLVDGRLHVIDGARMKYLALIGTGFAGTTVLSRDRKTIFVATTYHSRLERGTRSDVVEIYRADDLSFQREIETPGCYGVIAWPKQPRRFSALCGDGTLATYDLSDSGTLASSSISPRFFDPDVDPLFMHYELAGERLTFVSYHGQVQTVDLAGAAPVFAAPWSLLDAATRKQDWRPGGYELFAIDGGRLYVAMHDHGAEGTHKNPAKEIWVVDLKAQRRVARMPGQTAVSMAIAHGAAPRLFVLSGADNRLLAWDLRSLRFPYRPLARSEPVGDTPVYLELNQ